VTTWAAISAVALGLVFEWSGVAKVASRDAWQVEDTPFSTGSRAVDRLVRRVLPWFEIVLGGLLILRLVSTAAAAAAVVLLAVFTVALVRVLARGQRPPCMCFGATRPRPISWASVVRNLALIGLGIAVIVGA